MSRKKRRKSGIGLLIALGVVAVALTLWLLLGTRGESFDEICAKANTKSGIVYRSDKFVSYTETDVYPVLSGEKYYYKTQYNGKTLTLTEADFDDARVATEYSTGGTRKWYAAVCQNGKWGFLRFFESTDDKGKTSIEYAWLVEPIYENAEPFSDGVAAVRKNGKYGLIGLDGEELGAFSYDSVKFYSSDLLPVCKNGSWSFVNIYSKQMIRGTFTDAESFENGCAAVKTEKGWGYIDTKGNILVEPQYTDAWAVGTDGRAYVKSGSEWEKIQVVPENG